MTVMRAIEDAAGTWYTAEEAEALTVIGTRAMNSVSHMLPASEAFEDMMASQTSSGLPYAPDMAVSVSTAFACRRVIAEDIAKMAKRVVRVTRDETSGRIMRREAHDHPVHELLTVAPNDWMTAYELWEYMVGVATFHEASYCWVVRDPRTGTALELLPLLPGSVQTRMTPNWDVEHTVTGYGDTVVARPGDLIILRNLMRTPTSAFAMSRVASDAIALAAAIERSQARFHANDMRPSGILSTKAVGLSPEARAVIGEAWKRAYGSGGSGGIAVLDNDFAFSALDATSADSQVIENRRQQVEDVCRFFRVFPSILGHASGAQSYGSIEQMFGAHKEHTLHPWVERSEQSFTLGLFGRQAGHRVRLSVDLDMDSLARGTLTDRTSAYEKLVKFALTPNEVRAREGLDPIDDPAMDRVQLLANNTGIAPKAADAPPAKAERPSEAHEPAAPPAKPKDPTP